MSLQINNISFRYSLKKEFVFEKLSFAIPTGKVFALMGSSGCGKSTMLKVITGYYNSLSGYIQVNGNILSKKKKYGNFGYISQSAIDMLLPWFKVSDNINLPTLLRNINSVDNHSYRESLIEALELDKKLNDYPYEISGGEQKRLSLAVALSYKPDIILFDEPFSGIDIKLAHRLQEFLLKYFQKEKPTVLFVTHSLDEAAILADRTMFLTKEKEIILSDKSREDFFECQPENFESLLSNHKLIEYKEYLRLKLHEYLV
jgi:ABC-type nitrate/sulfonate/bicarbonate transport system ATPase subunit